VTLVLAVRCSEGVVLASDGQATSDAAGQPTRAPVRKLFALGGRIAWGAAGSVGLQQQVHDALAAAADAVLAAPDPRRALVDVVVPVQQRALREHVALPGVPPPELSCVFAWWSPGVGPRVFSIPRSGAEHQLHDRHAAVGTGDIFADFAMASIAHLGPVELSLGQAQVVALKVLGDAIDVAAVYLGPPIQMHTVRRAGAHPVSRAELDGPLAARVAAWQERQRATLAPG